MNVELQDPTAEHLKEIESDMQVLIGWEDASEAETIEQLLNIDGMRATVATDPGEFESGSRQHWDAVVMSLSFPDHEAAFDLYQRLIQAQPGIPVIGAWMQNDIAHLAKFIHAGLHSHLMRDEHGSCFMLMRSMIEAAIAAVKAQRAAFVAERLKKEVESVRRLQENVIPSDLPDPQDYRIAAKYEPSQIRVLGATPVAMAGGDYYDAFQVEDDRLVLLVGDASGHGVKACMSIMTMHTLIRMIRTQRYPNAADFVGEVNRRLCTNQIVQDEGGFITLLYSTLDLANHRLTWTSAGAPIPMVQDLRTNEVSLIGSEDDGGLPLAIDEDWEYEQYHFDIPDHSRLLIFTDGLDEAFPMLPTDPTEKPKQFGLNGIIRVLKETVEQPVEQALQRLFDASHDFTEGAGRMDDTSVLLLERNSNRSG